MKFCVTSALRSRPSAKRLFAANYVCLDIFGENTVSFEYTWIRRSARIDYTYECLFEFILLISFCLFFVFILSYYADSAIGLCSCGVNISVAVVVAVISSSSLGVHLKPRRLLLFTLK